MRWKKSRSASDDTGDLFCVFLPFAEQFRPFIELGFDHFIIDVSDFPGLTTLKTLAHEVLPLLNR
jgi:hypothetical protein